MVIIASNVERKAATDHIKTELAHRRPLLLAPICIVIKYPSIITILQFCALCPCKIFLADFAFRSNMGIYSSYLKMQRRHGLDNQSKAQHEVMVIIASNVESKAASLHIKTELAHRRPLLLAPICIVIKYRSIITILQF